MKAVRIHRFGDLDAGGVEVVPDPEPAPGELLIEIEAAPVNFVDLVILAGNYQFKPTLPYTPGKGPAGVVRAAGPGAGYVAGDRVLGMAEYGGYAEMVCVADSQCFALPAAMSFAEAAAMSLASDTAWMALRERARLASGETVLVLGASGAVGNAAVQLARAMGASLVLGGATSPERLAESVDVDGVVDLSQPDLPQSIRRQVYEMSGGTGDDIILDPLGGDPFDGAIRALNWRGRLVVIGFATGRIPVLKMNYPLLKNIEISGLQISDYRKHAPQLVAQAYHEIFSFYTEGLVSAPPTIPFALSDWKRALRMVEQRETSKRVLICP